MEDILAIILLFGGGTVILLAFSPIGRAIAERIRSSSRAPAVVEDPAVREEIDQLRHELSELHERVDFAERMLAQRADTERARVAPGAEQR
jgi:hypothetical protein